MGGLKPKRIRHFKFNSKNNKTNNQQSSSSSNDDSKNSKIDNDDIISDTLPTLSKFYKEIPQLTLNVDKSNFTTMKVKEGSYEFTIWYIIATYIPVLSACICPLANMISISALITKWRLNNETNEYLHDPGDIHILNSVSLSLGLLGNTSVIMNFGKRLPYKVCQFVTIISFYISGFILLTAILISNKEFNEKIVRTEGYWTAVITTVLYFGCGSLSFMNFSGALLNKYPPDFNLSNAERGLIVYNFMLSVWFIWGAALFSSLNDLSYSDAMYYCVVSLLTIGLGDELPFRNVSKALILLYSLTGIIILGLIIAMIRHMITSKASMVLFWNRVEIKRKLVYKKVVDEKIKLNHGTAFDLMRSIRKSAANKERTVSTIATIIVFVMFWLIGALIFHYVEHWSYFNSLYFCFVCLLTIGYGDFHPTTAAGKPLFIVWAIGAVPLMTCLISNISDAFFYNRKKGVHLMDKLKIFQQRFKKTLYEEEADILSSDDIDNEEERSIDEILETARQTQKPPETFKTKESNVFENLRTLIKESTKEPNQRYDYEHWHNVIQLLELEENDLKDLGIDSDLFWISDQSPLRFPINEPNYLLFLLFSKMESLITEEADAIVKENTRNLEEASSSP